MSSGSPFIGDARDRAAAFVARSHKTLPSLQVQTAPGDAFADVFRLIANPRPAPDRASSRGSQLRVDAGREQEDAVQKEEENSPSDSQDVRAPRRSVKDVPQDQSPVDMTLMVSVTEHVDVETDVATDPLTENDESSLQESPLSETEIVAASQYQTIVAASRSEDNPPTVETASEAVPVFRGKADDSASSNENVDAKPEMLGIPTGETTEPSVEDPLGKNAPADAKLVSKPDGSSKPVGNFSDDPVLPKPLSETLVSEPTEPSKRGEVSVDGLESEVTEETAKPLFGGRDDDSAGSRRRHERERGRPSFFADANRVAHDPSSAQIRGTQTDMLSTEAGADMATADRAVGDVVQAVDKLQANTHSAPPPAVSAAAAYGSATSDAASPKSSPKPTPQIGVNSAPPGTAENAQRPIPKESTGPGVADRIRLVQRVANAFQRLGMDGGQVRIRLHPAELGGVRLDLQIQGNRLNARVIAETEAARGVLREHLPDLRQRLAEQGIQIERIDVELETEVRGDRDAPHRDASAGRFDQPQRRDQRAEPMHSERDPDASSIEAGRRRNPVERSVADAVSRPGVDLVF